jgi:hypothetical protein
LVNRFGALQSREIGEGPNVYSDGDNHECSSRGANIECRTRSRQRG